MQSDPRPQTEQVGVGGGHLGRRSLGWKGRGTAGERLVLGPECSARSWPLSSGRSLCVLPPPPASPGSAASLGGIRFQPSRAHSTSPLSRTFVLKGAEDPSSRPHQAMAGYGYLGLGLFCWVLLAVPAGPQPASSVPGAPLTTLTPPPQSEASMLSLNLGLNFKFHLRGPAAVWGNPITETQALSPRPSREPKEEAADGLRTDPLWELLMGSLGNSPPEWGSAEGSSTPRASSPALESESLLSGPADGPTVPYRPGMGTVTWDTALTATATPSSAPRLRQSELELKFDVALRAGAAPTLGHRTLPLLPSLRASLAEIAGRLGPFGEYPPPPKESRGWAIRQVGGSFSMGLLLQGSLALQCLRSGTYQARVPQAQLHPQALPLEFQILQVSVYFTATNVYRTSLNDSASFFL